MDSFEVVDGGVPFPGWGAFEGPDSADFDAEARRAFESRAVAFPEAVTTGIVGYTHHHCFAVPVTLVCPELSSTQAAEWVRSGQLPEIAGAKHVDYVDIDSGHWPMLARPVELARVLAEIADA